MTPLLTQRIAWRALQRNKLRSFLTVLGIIIGVAAVIAMVAIGEGAKARVQATFQAMGTNLLVIQSGSSRGFGMRGGFGTAPTLTWADLKALETEVPSVRSAAPQLSTRAQIVADEQNWNTQVNGTTPVYFEIRSWSLVSGTVFTQSDVDSGAKVVILGQTVVDNLYGTSSDPVGQIVRIRNVPFEVIGVTARKGQSGWGSDLDDTVFIPVTTFQRKIEGSIGNFLPGVIYVGTGTSANTSRAHEQIAKLLRDRHRLAPGAEDDFSIRNFAEIASAQQESTETFTTLLAAIAAVSLLVGGIGIMNIMLVSVTERTREIGIRMAVGAKPRHILAQFLVESVTLSVLGGLFGVGLGVFTARRLAAKFAWPMIVRPDIVVVAVVFAALVGIGFGLYPARKAAKLDPIQALRYE